MRWSKKMYLPSIISQLLTNSTFYIILALLLFIFSPGKTYINVFKIITSYYREFTSHNRSVILIIVIIPICLANAINLQVNLNQDLIETIAVIISILMSLFFTYISYFQEYENKEQTDYNRKKINEKYSKETKSIASYEVLISVIILIICFIYPIFNNELIKEFISGLIYFLFFHMLINLLILLKRHNNSL